MLTEDWMMRQVEALARSIAYLVFHKDTTLYVPTGAEKLEAGDIGEAEDLLFQASEEGGLECLEVGVDFYARLNDLTDDQLKQAGFGRDEIQEGLQDLADQFGVSLSL